MTNEEKYRTAKERIKAFKKFCISHLLCHECPMEHNHLLITRGRCNFLWLELEAEEVEPKCGEIKDDQRGKV